MINDITTFKVRIDRVDSYKIEFELFVGDRVKDTYVDVLSKGGYGKTGSFTMSHKQFGDFATRLIAYVYTKEKIFSDSEFWDLWNLRINIYDHEAQALSKSIFDGQRDRLIKIENSKKEQV